jgi:hypothetical protein
MRAILEQGSWFYEHILVKTQKNYTFFFGFLLVEPVTLKKPKRASVLVFSVRTTKPVWFLKLSPQSGPIDDANNIMGRHMAVSNFAFGGGRAIRPAVHTWSASCPIYIQHPVH